MWLLSHGQEHKKSYDGEREYITFYLERVACHQGRQQQCNINPTEIHGHLPSISRKPVVDPCNIGGEQMIRMEHNKAEQVGYIYVLARVIHQRVCHSFNNHWDQQGC